MEIKVNVENKILKKFTINNLPDFIVITGGNGTGKTQLLKILSVENQSQPNINSDGSYVENFSSEIIDNGRKLNKVNYISNNDEMHGHYHINLGQKITPQVYVNIWGKLPGKYLSYLNQRKITPNSINLNDLNKRYQLDTGYDKNNVTQTDLILFNKIYSQKKDKSEPARIEECIVNFPLSSNNNLFTANLTMLYVKHKSMLDLGIKVKDKPWDIFNEILEEAEFPYKLNPPDLSKENFNIVANLIDIKNGKVIEIQNLSSGEKTIMSLILALYNSKNEITFPEVILFDEPDAALHPSMSKQMLDVLQNVFVKQQKVKVIITTHSPSTVALSPELSIFKMDRVLGKLVKTEKREAINSLTKGLDNINIYYENRKQIFVEANIDKYFYENTYSYIKSQGKLNDEIHLEFITTAKVKHKGDENGGCTFVKEIVNKLNQAGNNSTFGLIDFDNGNNNTSEIITILGKSNRHSIENYILDPIFLSYFILREIENKKNKFGFEETDTIRNFENINNSKLQNIIDKIVSKIQPNISDLYNLEKITYLTLNGFIIEIPLWYYRTKGHKLEEAILKSIYDLISFKYKNSICNPIIKKAIITIPEFLSIDILETFKELQEK